MQHQDVLSHKPAVAIAGFGCETSTFSPARTVASSFHVRRGDDVVDNYPFLQKGTELGDAAQWRGSLVGYALPGGIVTKDAFEQLTSEIVERLKGLTSDGPLDGLWFRIHGAMVVEGVEDSEAVLLRRIREVIGYETMVSMSMDLHGNVTRELLEQTDLITCYRHAPHIDVMETFERACRNLISLLKQHRERERTDLPLKAWIPIPVLLPGEQTSTRLEPAKSIYAAVPTIEASEGVIDASIWVGYAWADEPRCHAVVVVTGWDEQAVRTGAEKLSTLFWDAHEDFKFVAPTGSLDECLDAAVDSTVKPYFVSDSGDNPTAGGAGDVTWSLARLLARPELQDPEQRKLVYASIPGPEAVAQAVSAGIGATITVTAGAEVDHIHYGPLTMTGRVHAINHGDPHAVIEVVLQVGSIYVILTKLRKPYHKEKDFSDLNLNVRENFDIAVVKIGYLEPELYDMAADWMLALTPGGVDQDLERLGHKRIWRPMWPFDKKFEQEPDIRGRFVGRPEK